MSRVLKQQIRNVIKQHYGDKLEVYTRMAGDRPALMEGFVNHLARSIKLGSVPPDDCECSLCWFDGQPSPIDIELGKRVRTLRIQSLMSVKELANRMGVHAGYLNEIEQGKITAYEGFKDDAAGVLTVPHARWFLAQDLDEKSETEAWIRYDISRHFGRSLWSFRPEVSYDESITPFVKSLLELADDETNAVATGPVTLSPEGNSVKSTKSRDVIHTLVNA